MTHTALAAFAAAIMDMMVVTVPFADLCDACSDARASPGPDGGPCRCGDSCYFPYAAAPELAYPRENAVGGASSQPPRVGRKLGDLKLLVTLCDRSST